jgi:predicted nucleic acid-binding protein
MTQRSSLPLTNDTIVHGAELYMLFHQKGQLMSDADMLTAATALQHNLSCSIDQSRLS